MASCCCGGSGACPCENCLSLPDTVYGTITPGCGYLSQSPYRMDNVCLPTWRVTGGYGIYPPADVEAQAARYVQMIAYAEPGAVTPSSFRAYAGVFPGTGLLIVIGLSCGGRLTSISLTEPWYIGYVIFGTAFFRGSNDFTGFFSMSRNAYAGNCVSGPGLILRLGQDPLFPGFITMQGGTAPMLSNWPIPYCNGIMSQTMRMEIVP